MPTKRVYLVIGADRSVRAAIRPRLGLDEIAIAINLRFPDTWGQVVETLNFDVPDFTPAATQVVNEEAPAAATYGIDRSDDRWDRDADTGLWVYGDDDTSMATEALVNTWGPIRWYDAEDNEITSGWPGDPR